MTLPLDGLTVVSIEQAVAAPLCTARLADAGARVIKIERAGGDFGRTYDVAAKGDSSYFAWINHGKESVVLDFKSEADGAVLERMIAQADVLIQNLAPGALSRSGFDLQRLRDDYPSLITCSISGYGDIESLKEMKAYDLLVQAESGLISISGGPGEMGRIGVSLCDIGAGVTAYTGILEALIRRGKTHQGGHVDVSLFGVAAEWMSVPFLHAANGQSPKRAGLKHPSIAPYGAFKDAESILTLISIQNEREWERLCTQVLNAPELLDDDRYSSNDQRVIHRDALDAHIESITSTFSTDQFRAALMQASIAFGGLNSVTDLLNHAALQQRAVSNSMNHEVIMPAHPVKHAGYDTKTTIPSVPALNEHGQSLREEFGLEK